MKISKNKKKQKQTGPEKSLPVSTLLFIAFLEGCLVLSVEIIGAKMLIPYFGASFIVWTSVIGITLVFLTLGYFAGGRLSDSYNPAKVLFYSLFFASLFLAYMPVYVYPLLKTFQDSGIYSGSIFSASFLLGPPLFCLGTTSPLIIQLLSREISNSGKFAGTVYAFSTVGGIGMSLLTGFWIISEWGLSKPLVLLSILVFSSVALIFYEKKKIILFAAGTFLIGMQIIFMFKSKPEKNALMNIPYISEGLLGQIKVADMNDTKTGYPLRYLLVNGIGQTRIINSSNAVSFWQYVHRLSIFSSMKKEAGTALLFGFGAGSVTNELNRLGFVVDAVEIDERMPGVAKNYFYFNDSALHLTIDDARHFIMTNEKTYEIVIFDLLNGEMQPSYLFTLEGIGRVKEFLKEDAIVIVNFQELMIPKEIYVFKSIMRTFEKGGFQTYYSTDNEKGGLSDVIILASEKEIDFRKLKKENLTQCCAVQPWLDPLLKNPAVKLSPGDKQGVIFSDDRPMLDQLNYATVKAWRESMQVLISKPELNSGLKMFE